jgi:hypothetical protein
LNLVFNIKLYNFRVEVEPKDDQPEQTGQIEQIDEIPKLQAKITPTTSSFTILTKTDGDFSSEYKPLEYHPTKKPGILNYKDSERIITCGVEYILHPVSYEERLIINTNIENVDDCPLEVSIVLKVEESEPKTTLKGELAHTNKIVPLMMDCFIYQEANLMSKEFHDQFVENLDQKVTVGVSKEQFLTEYEPEYKELVKLLRYSKYNAVYQAQLENEMWDRFKPIVIKKISSQRKRRVKKLN